MPRVETKDLQIPNNLVINPEDWKVILVLDARITQQITQQKDWHQVALIMPKEQERKVGAIQGFQMKLVAVTNAGGLSNLAAYVMSLRHQGTLGFIAEGTGFSSIYIDRQNPSEECPKHSQKIAALVEKVNQYRGLLVSEEPTQADLEVAAIEIAPVLARFFDLEDEIQ